MVRDFQGQTRFSDAADADERHDARGRIRHPVIYGFEISHSPHERRRQTRQRARVPDIDVGNDRVRAG